MVAIKTSLTAEDRKSEKDSNFSSGFVAEPQSSEGMQGVLRNSDNCFGVLDIVIFTDLLLS